MFVIVATFDNADPQVFGPWPTRKAANDAHADLSAKLLATHRHHFESMVTREVQPA